MGRTNRFTIPNDPIYKTTRTSYYDSIKLIPPYEYYAFIDLVPSLINYRWEVKIGDAIAVEVDSNPIFPNEYYPYNSKWWPAIVTSIFKHNKDSSEDVKLEVRWLDRMKDVCVDDELVETDLVDEINGISLLGPISLHDDDDDDDDDDIIPRKKFTCSKFWSYSKNAVQDVTDFTVKGRRERGIDYSKHKGYRVNMLGNEDVVEGNGRKKRKSCDGVQAVSP